MDLDLLLSEHAPPVASRNPELDAALDEMCDRVTAAPTASRSRRRSRRTRVGLTGLATATVVGIGGIAAADLPWRFPWEPGTDVKAYSTVDGIECELVFTVSAGVDTSGDMAKARRVARRVLHRFQLDPDLLPATTYVNPHDEAGAFLQLASDTVNDVLADQGLPNVNVQAESVCTEGSR
jgi:hypothetical protein